MVVGTSRSEKSWVKVILVVRSQEYNLSFLRSNSIKCVKKSREGNLSSSSSFTFFFFHGISFNENCINVFKQNYRVGWSIVERSIKTIIIKLTTAKIEITNVELEMTSDSLCE